MAFIAIFAEYWQVQGHAEVLQNHLGFLMKN